MLGGLARRASFLENLRREKTNILLVDSGDLFFPPGSSPTSTVGKAKEMTSLMIDLFIKTYNLMGYDSFTPGEIDLSWGIAELKKISKQAKFTFLLSNLLDKEAKRPVFAPFLIKKTVGGKIGLFGLISDRFSLSGPPGDKEKFQIADPIETARKVITELKNSGCKIIIAVAHLEDDAQKRLAEALPDVHFIVSGHVRQFGRQPLMANHIEIIRAGTQGEYLGQMDFSVTGGKKERMLSSNFRLIPLHEEYADQDQTAKLVKEFKMQVVAILYRKDQTAIKEPASGGELQPLAQASPSFVGADDCLSCHPQQHASWEKTGHARAFQTLVRDKRSSDHTCLPCHTTGFMERVDSGGILENVQCEACHGTRRGHPENQQKFPPVSEKQCLICHNPAKSPNFDYIPYLSKVRCPTPR